MNKEFHQWCRSFVYPDRIILYKYEHGSCPYSGVRFGYIIAWDNISLDNINTENWS